MSLSERLARAKSGKEPGAEEPPAAAPDVAARDDSVLPVWQAPVEPQPDLAPRSAIPLQPPAAAAPSPAPAWPDEAPAEALTPPPPAPPAPRPAPEPRFDDLDVPGFDGLPPLITRHAGRANPPSAPDLPVTNDAATAATSPFDLFAPPAEPDRAFEVPDASSARSTPDGPSWLEPTNDEPSAWSPPAQAEFTSEPAAPSGHEAPFGREPFEPLAFEATTQEPTPFEPATYEPAPFETQAFEPAPFEAHAFEPAPFEAQTYEPPFEAQTYEPASLEPLPAPPPATDLLPPEPPVAAPIPAPNPAPAPLDTPVPTLAPRSALDLPVMDLLADLTPPPPPVAFGRRSTDVVGPPAKAAASPEPTAPTAAPPPLPPVLQPVSVDPPAPPAAAVAPPPATSTDDEPSMLERLAQYGATERDEPTEWTPAPTGIWADLAPRPTSTPSTTGPVARRDDQVEEQRAVAPAQPDEWVVPEDLAVWDADAPAPIVASLPDPSLSATTAPRATDAFPPLDLTIPPSTTPLDDGGLVVVEGANSELDAYYASLYLSEDSEIDDDKKRRRKDRDKRSRMPRWLRWAEKMSTRSKDDDGPPAEHVCPNCGGPASIDILDRNRGIRHMSCDSCFKMWQEVLPQ